jgi:hypothetical protein
MIAPKTEGERSEKLERYRIYNAKVKHLNNHVEVRYYWQPMIVLKEGVQTPADEELAPEGLESAQVKRLKAKRGESQQFDKANLIKSFTLMRDLAIANQEKWISFLTLTFRDNVTDLDEAHKCFHIWSTIMSREAKKLGFTFAYLGVSEFQERGAVHYHLMTNLRAGSPLLPYRDPKTIWDPVKKKYYTLTIYDIPYWKYGDVSSGFTLENVDDQFSVTGYLAKYFWKQKNEQQNAEVEGTEVDLRMFNRKKILCSRGLAKPKTEYLDTYDPEHEDYIKALTQGCAEVKNITRDPTSAYVPAVTIQEFVKKSED